MPAYRHILALDRDWRFLPVKAKRAWIEGVWPETAETVNLPHCWNAADTFQEGLRYRQGYGFYGCSFNIPSKSNRIPTIRQLRSEGFYGTGNLWVNGTHLGSIDGQYLGFNLDVTKHLKPGHTNRIVINLNNYYHPYVLPGKKMPDFLLHGGFAGKISLHTLPETFLDDTSMSMLCLGFSGDTAMLEWRSTLHHHGRDTTTCQVRLNILSPQGETCLVNETPTIDIVSGATLPLKAALRLPEARRWHVDSPTLYTVRAELLIDGEVRDAAEKRFGTRTAGFDGHVFLLNGEPLDLHGVNRHECQPGFGNALPDAIHRRDAALIKSLGLNLVRLSHYPQHPAFLDACDETGVLVYAEIASWKSVRPGLWGRAALRQFDAMVKRDRHHPSIILWGLANESRSRRVFRQMTRCLKRLDPTRETIYAENHLHRGRRWRTLKSVDVLGVNYELDRLRAARDASRKGSVLVSEMSNCPYTRRGDEGEEWKQVETLHSDFARIERAGGCAGYTLWCFCDYPTQRKQRIIRRPGIVDAWREPKMAATYMQARLCHDPVLKLYANWNKTDSADHRQVYVITNCDTIRLQCGHDQISAHNETLMLSMTITFQDQPLTVIGLRDNHEVAQDLLLPFERATRLRVIPEWTEDGVIAVRIAAADPQGVTDRNWMETVTVETQGPVQGHAYTHDGSIEMSRGTGRFFARCTEPTGQVMIRGSHPELESGHGVIRW